MLLAPGEKSRETIYFKSGITACVAAVIVHKHLQNADSERGETPQVHAIVAKNVFHALRSATEVVKVDAGNL